MSELVTVEIGTSSVRVARCTPDGPVAAEIRLHPMAASPSGELLVGTPAEEHLRDAPQDGFGPFVTRVGDVVPMFVANRRWEAHEVLASVIHHHVRDGERDAVDVPPTTGTVLYEQGIVSRPTALRVVTPADWGPHRRRLMKEALVQHGFTVDVVSSADAALAALDVPADAQRIILVAAGERRLSATVMESARTTPGEWRVAAVAGHDYGGIDMDDSLLGFVTHRTGDGGVLPPAQLRGNCRTAREELSQAPAAQLNTPEPLRLVRADLEALTGPDLRNALATVLLQVGVARTDTSQHPMAETDHVVLTGGLAGMPLVVETLSELIGRPVHVPEDPAFALLRAAVDLPLTEAAPAPVDEVPETEPHRRRLRLPKLPGLPQTAVTHPRRVLAGAAAAAVLVVAMPLAAPGLTRELTGWPEVTPASSLVVPPEGAPAPGTADGPQPIMVSSEPEDATERGAVAAQRAQFGAGPMSASVTLDGVVPRFRSAGIDPRPSDEPSASASSSANSTRSARKSSAPPTVRKPSSPTVAGTEGVVAVKSGATKSRAPKPSSGAAAPGSTKSSTAPGSTKTSTAPAPAKTSTAPAAPKTSTAPAPPKASTTAPAPPPEAPPTVQEPTVPSAPPSSPPATTSPPAESSAPEPVAPLVFDEEPQTPADTPSEGGQGIEAP